MLFTLMKKWEKIVFYEFNISFQLIFREWKMVLNNLTLGIKMINFGEKYKYLIFF